MEREELWEWIDALVRKTGLELGEDVDITEEWREWWIKGLVKETKKLLREWR